MLWIGLVLIICHSAYGTNPMRELWNEQIDLITGLFDIVTKQNTSNLEFIAVPNLIAANISFFGVKLGFMWSLKRDSDIFMEILDEGDVRINGRFTLECFKLVVTKLKYNSYNGPANLTASKNSVNISYKIKKINKPWQCQTEWELFVLDRFKKIILLTKDPNYDGVDITEDINTKFIPEVNMYFKTHYFQKYLNNYLDFCYSKLFH